MITYSMLIHHQMVRKPVMQPIEDINQELRAMVCHDAEVELYTDHIDEFVKYELYVAEVIVSNLYMMMCIVSIIKSQYKFSIQAIYRAEHNNQDNNIIDTILFDKCTKEEKMLESKDWREIYHKLHNK